MHSPGQACTKRCARRGYPFICLFQNVPNQRASYARPFITPGTETSFITENPWVKFCIVLYQENQETGMRL